MMDDSSNSSTRRGPAAACALLLVLATAAVFGRVAGHEFLIWDDDQHVTENPNLNPVTWRGVGQFWQRPFRGLYIPLSYTFFAAEASIARQPLPGAPHGRPNPIVFHSGNLALHVVCVLLVFTILRRLVRHDGAACAGALLFGLHPVQVESAAWISETRGLLCGLFSLLAIWQYLRYAETSACRRRLQSPIESRDDSAATGVTDHSSPTESIDHSSATGVASYIGATVCFGLALLCKPAAAAVPLIVAALDWGWLRRPPGRILLVVGPWLFASAGWLVITKLQQPDQQLPLVPPLWARPLLAGDALAFYLDKLVVPLRLAPDYGHSPQWVMQQWWFYAAWLLPAAALVFLASLRDGRVWLTAAAVWVAWVLPVLGLVPFVFQRISTVADRYLYLALLGPAMALSWLLARRWNRWSVAVTTTVLALLGVLSWFQTGHWRDDLSLISHGLRVNPRSAVAKQHLGLLLARGGEHDEAIKWYSQALKDHPAMAELHLGLGASWIALKKPDKAVEVLREAVRQLPREPLLHTELGIALAKKGAIEEAVSHYRRALSLDPRCTRALVAWGNLLLQQGAAGEAIQRFRTALDADPNHVPARVNLALALQALHRGPEARYQYEAALRIRPHDPVAHYCLANLLASQGDLDEAVDHYRAALKADPRYVQAHVNLGRALAAAGRAEEARAAWRAALRLLPPDSEQAERIRELLRPDEKSSSR